MSVGLPAALDLDMFSRLRSFLAGTAQYSHPSTVLVLGEYPKTSYILHIIPEDGTSERVDFTAYSSDTLFRHSAKERSREQLGTVLLHVGDGETPTMFLADVKSRVQEDWSEKPGFESAESAAHAVSEALRSAALDFIGDTEKREAPLNAAQSYPVFSLRIDRPNAGKILTDAQLTSICRM